MSSPDVLVVGGGPAGTAAAHWLARAGHEVLVVEKKEYPREKTCGDGLTPRSILQLIDMGFDFSMPEFHRVHGLRAYSSELMIELEWPDHPTLPAWGGVIRRSDLDMQVAALAEKQGAVVQQHTTASPVVEAGRITAVDLAVNGSTERVEPGFVIVADGSLSRFGRALGAVRDKDRPYGLAARAYYTSPMAHDGFMESQLDLRDAEGATVPGYGWVFPMGDGSVNVGVGVLSTFHRWKKVNTSNLMDAMVASAPEHWGLTADSKLTDPRGGKLPMSFSVGPLVGSNWLLVGDAAGAINPFNGEGIAYAYETGRMAADHVGRAIEKDDRSLIWGYRDEVLDEYDLYYRVARAFVRVIGQPGTMRILTRTGLRNKTLMEWVLRVMANILRPDERHLAEAAYRMVERVVTVGPEPW
ncbi:MAG TPA: geranylgeranyl reductase family protein [Acidimicrobiia bacterium]|nr:geranylgeranyl reductase family protein [Acidimicrobiia bacterium]